jgi:hypothetical protein
MASWICWYFMHYNCARVQLDYQITFGLLSCSTRRVIGMPTVLVSYVRHIKLQPVKANHIIHRYQAVKLLTLKE